VAASNLSVNGCWAAGRSKDQMTMAPNLGTAEQDWAFLVNHPLKIIEHGSLNVPIEHHPTIRYMVYNGYYKVTSNIPKIGQLPTPVEG